MGKKERERKKNKHYANAQARSFIHPLCSFFYFFGFTLIELFYFLVKKSALIYYYFFWIIQIDPLISGTIDIDISYIFESFHSDISNKRKKRCE